MRKELPRYQEEVNKAIDSMDSEVSKKRAAVEKTMTAARTEDINCRSISDQAVDQNPVWRPSELLTDDVLVQIIVKSHEAAVGEETSTGRWDNYILHELLADGTDVLAERGREHHHLLGVRRRAEYLLDVTSHICTHTPTNRRLQMQTMSIQKALRI